MTASEPVPLGAILAPADGVITLQPDETYRMAGIYSFGRGLFERESILGADTAYATLTRLRVDQFVVSKLNGWEGAVDVVDPELDGCHVSGEYPVFSVDLDRADPGYLRWIARWPTFWDLLIPRGSMVRRKRIQPSQLLEVEIPLPSLEEQRRVAALLELAAQASDDLDNRIRRSTELAVAAQVSLVSHPGAEPSAKGWERTPIGDLVVASHNQVTVEPFVEYRIAGIYSFGKGLIDRGRISGADTSYKVLTRLDEGNIVMSKLNGWEGAVAVVDSAFHHAHVSSEFPTFVVDESRLLPGFFRGVARSSMFWDQLNQTVRGSMVRRRRLSGSDFMRAQIWLPSIEHQTRVSREIDALDRLIERSGQSAVRAAAIVPAILNQEFVVT